MEGQDPCLLSWLILIDLHNLYMDNAGLEIAIVNGGPATTLESMGAKPSFRCHSLNIGQMYKQ